MARSSHRKGAIAFPFVAVPKAVLASPEWQQMPFAARALALDLMGQYTGKNNGRLCPSFEVMARSNWTSKTTLVKAKRALLDRSFAVLTRKGHPPRTAEWIGFTWWSLDYHDSMNIDPKLFPYMNFLSLEAAAIDPNEGREKARRTAISVVQKLDRYPSKTALRGPETGPMEASI